MANTLERLKQIAEEKKQRGLQKGKMKPDKAIGEKRKGFRSQSNGGGFFDK